MTKQEIKDYTEDFTLDYKQESELSYKGDPEDEYVSLLLNKKIVADLFVYIDKENSNREYIIINHTMVYLDTLAKKHEYLNEEDYYEIKSVNKGRSVKWCEHCGGNIEIGVPHEMHHFYPEFQAYATHLECSKAFKQSLS